MKNKPTKHKESNTFRFVPFADRIASIDVDVFHQIDRRRGIEDEGESQTFFFLALEKWSVLNCTESYSEFRRRLVSPADVETLPQLLLQSETIAKTLLKELAAADYLSLQPLLECVIALARDLHNNFYPFFPSFLVRIVNILTAPLPREGRGQKEAEITEWCLSCLAHLCKILWRSMLKDWQFVYGSLLLPLISVRNDPKLNKYIKDESIVDIPSENEKLPELDEMRDEDELIEEHEPSEETSEQPNNKESKDLLNGKNLNVPDESFREKLLKRPPPEYIKDFVVQSFAYVARKAKNKSIFLESVTSALKGNKSGILGTAQLLAEVMKGVQGLFHSCAESFLPMLLQLGCCHEEESDNYFIEHEGESKEDGSITFQLVRETLVAVMSSMKPDKGACLLWKCLLDLVKQCTKNYKIEPSDKQRIKLHRSVMLLHLAINFNGSKWLFSEIAQNKGMFTTTQAAPSLPLPNQLTNVIVSILQITTINNKIALEVGGMAGSILSSPAITEGRLRLGQEVAAKLTNQVLAFPDTNVIINFVQRTTHFPGFEALVLPHLMSFCNRYCSKSSGDPEVFSGRDVLHLLASLVIKKSPPCTTGGNALQDWKQYRLDFTKISSNPNEDEGNNFYVMLQDILSIPIKKDYSHLDVYTSALIILPHLRGIDHLGKILIDSIKALFDALEENLENDSLKKESLYFIISESLISAVLTKDGEGRISRHISFDRVVNSLLKHATIVSRLPVLRALDCYISASIKENPQNISGDNLAFLNQLYTALSGNLSSPYREVCRLTLNFLAEVEMTIHKENYTSVFRACLAAEEIPLSIHSFREKIGLLEVLKPTLNEANDSEVLNLHYASLQYLLGIHFVNFRLIWEPTCKLIATHGHASKNFWAIFVQQFKLSMAFVKVDAGCKLETNDLKSASQMIRKWEKGSQDSFLSHCDFLSEWYAQRFTLSDSPDFVNYRIQLLNTMCEAPEICEARNRDISEIFLSFHDEEFMKSDSKLALTWDIRKAEENVEVDGSGEDDDEFGKNVTKATGEIFSVRFSTKTMVAFLSLLSKMRNPKAMYREPELAKVYNDLVSHRNPEIQKYALDCLLAFRCKTLLPYRENLYNLIDEKRFKSELNLFRIDKDSEIVKEEHRSQLIPVVMQVLYSKMQSGNKRTSHLRRSLVLRFIAGCHDVEVVVFLKLAFNLLTSFIKDDSEEVTGMVRRIKSSVELEQAVHPKRLLSTSNLLVVVVERLGSLLLPFNQTSSASSEALRFLLRCLFCTNALVAGEYSKRDLVHPCHLSTLRSARTSGLAAVTTFFRRLDRFPWTPISFKNGVIVGDMEALFEACIWPWLDQLPIEGIHSPTALLKLFIVWTENPRYFPLLAKKRFCPEGQFDAAIPAIMRLLGGNKTKPSVVNAILDMIERLITYASEDEIGIPMEVSEESNVFPELPPLDVGPIIQLQTECINDLQLPHKLNFGSSLILPYVPCILKVLYERFRSLKKGSSPSARDLRVLSLLSELVWEPGDSESLVQLILPIAVRKASLGATGEQMCQLLLTANNLLRNVPNPIKFFRAIAPLFGIVDGHNARSILCQILETVASYKKKSSALAADVTDSIGLVKNNFQQLKMTILNSLHELGNEDDIDKIIFNEDLKTTSKIINDLNSWDPSRLEEPNYGRRLDAYKELKVIREKASNGEEKFPLMLGILLIHNSFHAIKNEKDLSLRESAGYCLQTLAPMLAISVSDHKTCRNLVVGDTLLTLITKTLKDRKSTETLLYDTVGTLRALVVQCPNLHPILKDLTRLASHSDPEVDFFENIRHLQLHRRGRALMRFVQDAKEAPKPMGPQTLTGVILPLAFQFLFNARYAKNNSLVDSAIEAIGASCHCLPWHHYEAVLKHQLGRLHRETSEFGRQPIRLIVAILNNFHFNLSRADENSEKSLNISKSEIVSSTTEFESVPIVEEEEEGPEEVLIGTEVLEMNDADEDNNCLNDVPAWSQDLILPGSIARRARKSLSTILLPRLHASLVAPTERDSSHKLNRRAGGAVGAEFSQDKEKRSGGPKDEEETLVMRVPIALAAVKMLQRLPTDFMSQHLNGVLLKVLAFLKCRLESVRRVAREILVEIGVSLGPKYLPMIVREMSSLLLPTRGYAFHVLSFTAHSILVALAPIMDVGDIDKCLQDFLEICKADLFGITAEEKEVTRITAKVYEARSHKSYDSFQLLAKVVSESCLIDLLHPLKEVLDHTHSFKFVRIVKECLSRIVKGLVENKFVSSASLLTFSYGVLSNSIVSLWPSTAFETKKVFPRRSGGAYAGPDGKVSQPLALPSDPYLIPKEPRKARSKISGAVDKVGAQANAHAVTEFGLHLLNSLLKKEHVKWRKGTTKEDSTLNASSIQNKNEVNEELDKIIVMDIAMLDPLVPIICECLESQHAKITTLALNCFRMMVKMELPSMEHHLVKAAKAVYMILHKYAGATSGDNYNLAVAAFKAVAVLVRSVKSLPVEEDHLSALLNYVSRDLDLGGEVGSMIGGSGPARTATAFGVLRSVLARKLRSALIPPLMKTVAQLSITAEATHIQAQSRQVFLHFLMDYPMSKKKLDHHLSFYLRQLDYKLLSGRESALEFLQSVISTFPPGVLKNFSGPIYVSLAARLMEEDVPQCKRRVAAVIKSLLLHLNHQSRDALFNVLVIWMKDSKVSHQQLAVQLCGIFVLALGDAFSSHLPVVVPLIIEQLKGKEKCNVSEEISTPGRLIRPVNDANNVGNDEPSTGRFVRLVSNKNKGENDENCPGKYVRMPPVNEHEQLEHQKDDASIDSAESDFEEKEKSKKTEINNFDFQNDSDLEDALLEPPEDMEELKDHHLFLLLQLILKILITCPVILSKVKWRDEINDIAVCAQKLLAYPHEWVRLASSQVLGSIFASIEAEKVALAAIKERDLYGKTNKKKRRQSTSEETNSDGIPFLFVEVNSRLKSLILDHSSQLEHSTIGPQLAEQVVKNLVFLARVLKNIENLNNADEVKSNMIKEKESNLSLLWMMRKMRKIVNLEVTLTPNQTIMRSSVFKWLAALALDLSSDPDHLKTHLHQILGPVIREVENTAQGKEPRTKEVKELRRLAYEVCELIKEKVGLETYAEVVRDIQNQLTHRRTERRRIRAQEVISMPEKAAKRKIKKQLVKKQLKRRKISLIKGQRVVDKKRNSIVKSIF